MRVDQALQTGAGRLPRREGLPDPRREASWLLAAAWGVDEVVLRLHPDRHVPDDVQERFYDWVARRATGVPAHHLVGRCPFWGREFEVNPQVLVPRPETELVVEVALQLPLAAAARVLDVGTGTGCIAVTLAAERPRWRVAAVDRSAAAVLTARRNARRHGVDMACLVGDLGAAVSPPWDLVVANLPYVPVGRLAELPLEVRHDPPLALDGGGDGLAVVRRLVAELPRLLRLCGGAVLELGEGQANEVAETANRAGLAVARTLRDAGGCERILVVQPRG